MSQGKLVTVSVKAATKIREFMAQQGKRDLVVHVSLVQTHCMGGAGYAYHFGFAKETRDGQESFENGGLRFAVDASSASRLHGTTIDYVETLESQGFVVNNPNAIAKCPCGHHDLFDRMSTQDLPVSTDEDEGACPEETYPQTESIVGALNMPSRELSFDSVEREIRDRRFGVLSTVSLDHRPHSTGVLYGVSSRDRPFALYVTTNRDTKKARNIARNPNVSFTIPIPRRLLGFLPPHCVQFQGRAEIVSFEDEDARNAFSQSLVLREVLKLEGKHVGPKAIFIRIQPDQTIHTYGLGLSFLELLRNIRGAASRVEIPASRL